ncbi:heavy metal translocating P-type ATPase [Desmospora profundinema]|nr:heavy metal translocating P-type ATPase [Desmospora profundinema]
MPQQERREKTGETYVYRLTGLTCADCAAKLERMIGDVPGVEDVRLNFGASKVTVVGKELSVQQLNRLGAFDGIRVMEEEDGLVPDWAQSRQTFLTGLSLTFLVAAFLMEWLSPSPLSVVLFAAATVLGGWETAKKGIPNLLRLRFDMNALMTVAVGGALGIGYWEEAAVVAFLFGVSETLQVYTTDKARSSLRNLLSLAPPTAVLLRDGREITVPVEEVEVGETMVVKPGEKLAMDGLILRGRSSINQAAITGESIPVVKEPGDEVFAGTFNEQGTLDVKVTKRSGDTTLAKIIAMVEDAQEKRTSTQSFVDRFAAWYTPAILVLAAGILLLKPLLWGTTWTSSLYDALALLIVACPCALVVSTPMAIVSAIGNAANNGVLIKGGIHLENAGSIQAIAFDKTGTLTKGEPVVTDVIPLAGQSERELLTVAAGLERRSEHPIARAILRYAEDHSIDGADVTDFTARSGLGAEARLKGTRVWIGNPRLFQEEGLSLGPVKETLLYLQQQGKTAVLLGNERGVTGLIAVADEVREKSRRAVAALKENGIQHTILLTGDNEATARTVAGDVGVDQFRSELLPADKVKAVEELRRSHGKVAMVGDGINDAPALATATTGVAMGGAGTDTALETADIVLMADDLSKLPFTVRLSRSALRVIKQNITFALLTKFIAVYLVFPGWLTLWLAIFADMGATILVALNSLRLLRIRP